MKGFADFAPRPGGPPQEPREAQPGWTPLQGDVDMGSSVSRSDTHENGSAGRTSQGSDSSDSAKELCGCQSNPLLWSSSRPSFRIIGFTACPVDFGLCIPTVTCIGKAKPNYGELGRQALQSLKDETETSLLLGIWVAIQLHEIILEKKWTGQPHYRKRIKEYKNLQEKHHKEELHLESADLV
ncbi:uncharacterized protein LOC143688451 isoform X1 [Tamandua tetradactyla]|uniref:uncharacterized protein LOC143688451 isoform X1 n=1 Tax=Tamandua tetradactyla TaxID=48850 RepID=UPI004053BBEB